MINNWINFKCIEYSTKLQIIFLIGLLKIQQVLITVTPNRKRKIAAVVDPSDDIFQNFEQKWRIRAHISIRTRQNSLMNFARFLTK